MSSLFVVRHGATEWSRNGRHTSTTDLPLLPDGEAEASALAPVLATYSFAAVLTSPMQRARRTAALAGFPDAVVDDDLMEWNYGAYEGLTRAQITERDPAWTIWHGPTPDGESPAQVSSRLDRLIRRVRSIEGDVLVFSHGHTSRALAARWLGATPQLGRSLQLDTATISRLGDDRGTPVIQSWNSSVALSPR